VEERVLIRLFSCPRKEQSESDKNAQVGYHGLKKVSVNYLELTRYDGVRNKNDGEDNHPKSAGTYPEDGQDCPGGYNLSGYYSYPGDDNQNGSCRAYAAAVLLFD
jgi:hypothetical protein